EFNHNINATYNSFDIFTFKFIAANLSINTTSNKIVNSIDSVSQGIQLIKPINLNGAFNSSSFVTLGVPFKNSKLKGSSVNLTNSVSYARDVSMLYEQKNVGRTTTVTQGAGINFNLFNERLDLGINASVSYYNLKYSVNKALNENYFTQSYSADFSVTLPANFIVASDFDYYLNSGRTDGFNQAFPLWNASLSRQFLKNRNAELKFSCNDILNRNQAIARTAADNFIEDTRTNVLRRYYMIGLLVNINKMGKNGNPMQNMSLPKQIERALRNLHFVN
ncbi:MAG TPA: outer membrane beta-barrel protein, partial [Chitinophagaceae bacterium]|nr:outer membrane beta-barrel protein [Chitinophagaceae bacterium]